MATTIYKRKSNPFREDYSRLIKQNYHANARNIHFDTHHDAINKMNHYIYNHTNHHIRNFLPDDAVNGESTGFAVSAVSFVGVWKEPFLPSETGDVGFHASNKLIHVPMMKILEKTFNYCEDSMVQMVTIDSSFD